VDILAAIRSRRSVGKLAGEVPREVVRELIEAATCAPNHHLTEPWRFTVFTGEARERLGRFWGEVAARDAGAQGAQRDAIVAAESRKLLRAPVVIVVSTRTDPDPVIAAEDHSATAAAIENLLLAAEAHGYAAMWRTGKMAYAPETLHYLGLEPHDRIIGVVYVGEPATAPRLRPQQRDVDRVIRWVDGGPAAETSR
jgi:nitroreductase